MSPVPVDPRIEAAAKAIAGNQWFVGGDATHQHYRQKAIWALAAADAVLTPPQALSELVRELDIALHTWARPHPSLEPVLYELVNKIRAVLELDESEKTT